MTKKKETLQVEHIACRFALSKDSNVESGMFTGIASVWGSPVDTIWNVGVRTKFRRGAFLKSINDSGNRVKILAQHSQEDVWIGLPTLLQETDEGLLVTASLNKTSIAEDYAAAIRHAVELGRLNAVEFSIGFDPMNHEMEEDADGEMFRVITEARLWEISVVGMGADRQTRLIEAASAADRRKNLLPRNDLDASFQWAINQFRAARNGAAPFSDEALLSEDQRKQLHEELSLHVPAESPDMKALTEYHERMKLAEIELAEAEASFMLQTI